MRARLFWKLGLSYLALLFVIFLALDFYSSHVLRRDDIRAATDTLASLTKLAEARPPHTSDPADLRAWTSWAASSGARVTVIAQSGQVLADSAHDPGTMENQSTRPEIQQAFSSGEGESARHSATLGVRFHLSGRPVSAGVRFARRDTHGSAAGADRFVRRRTAAKAVLARRC